MPYHKRVASKCGRKPRQRSTSPESKIGRLEAMLRREEGATISQLTAALNWQAHTVRAAISASLRKANGLTVAIGENEGGERVYRITS